MFEVRNINGKSFNQSNDAKGWKIVHNENKIILLTYGTETIGTPYQCYYTPNFRSMKQYIEANNLDVSSIELFDYDSYYNEVIDGVELPNDQPLIDFLNTFNFSE